MIICSLIILLSQFWTSPLFHTLLLLDSHASSSGDRSGSLIFPSLRIFQFSVIHIVKGFHVVNEAEVDVFFLKFPYFLYDPMNVWYLISGSSAFSKTSLYTWKFSVHILVKPSSKDFEHNLSIMWNDCFCPWVHYYLGEATNMKNYGI